MLIVYLPIFVAGTKITFVYNFVAPLKWLISVNLLLSSFLAFKNAKKVSTYLSNEIALSFLLNLSLFKLGFFN